MTSFSIRLDRAITLCCDLRHTGTVRPIHSDRDCGHIRSAHPPGRMQVIRKLISGLGCTITWLLMRLLLCRTERPDLIVMGRSRVANSAYRVRSGAAYRVINAAPCPVLTIWGDVKD